MTVTRWNLARLIEALSDPSAYPQPVDGGRGAPDAHLGRLPGGPVRLQDQEAGRPGLRRLQHPRAASALLRGGSPLEPPPGAGGLPRGRPRDPGRRVRSGWRAPARSIEWAVKMRRLPEPATLRARLSSGEVTRRALEELARRLARFHVAAESGPEVAAGVPLRGDRPQRPREPRAVGAPGGRDAQPIDPRSVARPDRAALARLRDIIEIGPRARHPPRHPRRPPPRSRLLVPRPTSARRLDHRRLHRVRRAVPPRRPDRRHRLPRHGAGARGPRRPRRRLRRGVSRRRGRRGGSRAAAVLPGLPRRGARQGRGHEAVASPRSPRPSGRRRDPARALWLLALSELEDPGRRPCLVLLAGLPGTGSPPWPATWPSGPDSPSSARTWSARSWPAATVGPAPAAFGEDLYTPGVERADLRRVPAPGRGDPLRGETRAASTRASATSRGAGSSSTPPADGASPA